MSKSKKVQVEVLGPKADGAYSVKKVRDIKKAATQPPATSPAAKPAAKPAPAAQPKPKAKPLDKSEASKKVWQNPEMRERIIAGIKAALARKKAEAAKAAPTKPAPKPAPKAKAAKSEPAQAQA